MICEFELAVFNPSAIALANEAGVKRIEYCSSYALGGISPDANEFKKVRAEFSGELLVMIRSRGGDFVYNDVEVEEMLRLIDVFDRLGADGFVFGCLTKDNKIDKQVLHRLMDRSGKKKVTFHRAIDQVDDYEEGVKSLIDHGVARILTSGKAKSAMEGKEMLRHIQHRFGHRIEIVAGGGVRSTNVSELIDFTRVSVVHSAAILSGESPDAVEVKKILSLVSQ